MIVDGGCRPTGDQHESKLLMKSTIESDGMQPHRWGNRCRCRYRRRRGLGLQCSI